MQDIDLRHGNCLEVLQTLSDDSVNLVLTSPPYNMNLRIRNGKYCSRQIVKEISTKYDGFDDNLPMEDYYKFNVDVIDQLLRVCDGPIFYNVQFLTGNKPALFKIIGKYAEQMKEFIIWDKLHGQPAIGEGVMNSQFEVLLVLDKNSAISRQFSQATFDRGTLSNLWAIRREKPKYKDHGATFPSKLVDTVISNFSKEGDVVLDPFMGTGSSGIGAKKLGRKYIGIELIEKYYKYSVEDINNAVRTDLSTFNQFFKH